MRGLENNLQSPLMQKCMQMGSSSSFKVVKDEEVCWEFRSERHFNSVLQEERSKKQEFQVRQAKKTAFSQLWLELTPRSFVPLAQDTAGSQKCCCQQLVTCILNNFPLLQCVGQVSRRTSKKYVLIQDKLGGLFKKFSEFLLKVTCPTNMKLNQRGQDIYLPAVIQFGGNPGCNKKVTFNSTFLDFCH